MTENTRARDREMKVYFAGAITGDRIALKAMQELVRYLQECGITVLTEHVAADDPKAAQLKIYQKSGFTPENVEKQDLEWLDQSTHVIAEVSGASTGTGREIEYARMKGEMGKKRAKVLCLYQKAREKSVSFMILGMTPDRYPNVRVVSYSDVNDAIRTIREFLAI